MSDKRYTLRRSTSGNYDGATRVLQKALGLIPNGKFDVVTEYAVKNFQKDKRLTVDGVVGPKTWAALGDGIDPLNVSSVTRPIDEVIVHCSDTVAGRHYSVDDIRRWHLARGFSDVGYHFVVYVDGSINPGRPIKTVGAHCIGHNNRSVGICYIGGKGIDGKYDDTRNKAQKDAMLFIIRELKALYPNLRVFGHRDFAAKACPCFDARKEYADV